VILSFVIYFTVAQAVAWKVGCLLSNKEEDMWKEFA
jgi:hypothetical protein